MTDTHNDQAAQIAKDEADAALVAGHLRTFLVDLQAATGLDPLVILAGAHAQVITLMTITLGGPMTALSCAQAAERVCNEPSFAAASLAFTPPAGTA